MLFIAMTAALCIFLHRRLRWFETSTTIALANTCHVLGLAGLFGAPLFIVITRWMSIEQTFTVDVFTCFSSLLLAMGGRRLRDEHRRMPEAELPPAVAKRYKICLIDSVPQMYCHWLAVDFQVEPRTHKILSNDRRGFCTCLDRCWPHSIALIA
jgi:hypothetical protein